MGGLNKRVFEAVGNRKNLLYREVTKDKRVQGGGEYSNFKQGEPNRFYTGDELSDLGAKVGRNKATLLGGGKKEEL